eukprot:s2048_g6.t1
MGGKRPAWADEEWSDYSYSYSGWGRPQAAAKPPKSRGKGKDKDKTKKPKEEGTFPTYEDMVLPSQAGTSGKGRQPSEQAQPGPGGRGGLSRQVQRIVNNLRRSETRIRKIAEEETAAKAKWDEFQAQLKSSFVKERARFYENMERLKTASAEQTEIQEEALDELQRALAHPEEDRIWTAQKEKECAARAQAEARTPPRRERAPEPVTPPTRDRPAKPTTGAEKDHGTDADAWLEGAKDKGPFPASPTLAGAMPSPSKAPSRPRATNPRTPVKTHTKPAQTQPSRTSLADKLNERRAAARGSAGGPMLVESEDEAVGDLGRQEPERQGAPSHGGRLAFPGRREGHLKGLFQKYTAETCAYMRAHLTSVPQQGFAFSPQELATMMVWHGPTGGHVQHAAADFSLGERRHKTYDALDLGEQLWWCLCSLFEWINGHLGEAPATVERSFFLAHFGALRFLLYRGSYSSKPARQRSRLGTSGHMARPLLCSVAQGGSPHGGEHTTIQQLGRLSGVGPAAAPPRPPSQTDLELWASGQLTMREQMVTAYDRLLRDRPLSHSAREAAPTNLEASADVMDGIPALTPEERRAVHISVWVATPFFEPEVIDMGLTRGSFCNAVKGTSWMLPDYVETIIPTTPQLSPFFGSCVAVPPWVQAADMSVFVVDGRRIGSQAYAIYQRGPVTKSSVARWLPEDDQDEVDVYCFGETVALGDGHHTQPIQGGIIQVVYQGEPCDWADTLEARPKDRPDRVPGPGQRQRRTAEDLLNYARGQCWLRSPTSPLVHVAHAGRRIVRQIAVNPGPRSTQLDDPDLVVVFADLRGLGFLSAMDYANGHRLRHAGLH